jgi:hypothetical protein
MAVGGLGRIVRSTRRNGAPGYDIMSGGSYSHFLPDWCAHPAVIGDTVCPHPYGTHWCGRTHVTADELTYLPHVTETATEDTAT